MNPQKIQSEAVSLVEGLVAWAIQILPNFAAAILILAAGYWLLALPTFGYFLFIGDMEVKAYLSVPCLVLAFLLWRITRNYRRHQRLRQQESAADGGGDEGATSA